MKFRWLYKSICMLLLLAWSAELHAQDQRNGYSFDFRGVPLIEVLDQVARETQIDLVYDPSIVKGFDVYERIQNLSVPNLLQAILSDAPLDFIVLSSGTVVIVKTVTEEPAYGTYFGKVVDSQTSEPLSGATVMLADASGGTSTSQAGRFSINKLLSGKHTIVFSYIGYEPVYKKIDIHPDQNLEQKIVLTPKPIDFAPIVVTGHTPQMPRHGNNGQAIDPNSEWAISNRMKSAIRSLTLFSGVQYGLPMTELHLQGGQSGEHRILLDGVPVYNPRSFGQMFSAFSPFAISKVRLYKAGYGVKAGSQIAGQIDLQHDVSGINSNELITQADPLSVNLRGDLQFPQKSKDDESSLKIMGAGRINYWNLFKEPVLERTLKEWNDLDPVITNMIIDSLDTASLYEPREHNSDVRFYDLHLASRYKVDPYNTLSGSFYLGENLVNTDLLRQGNISPEYLYARDEYKWNNLMGQLSYNALVSPRLDLSIQLSYSANKLRHRYLIGTSNTPGISFDFGSNSSADALANFDSAREQNLVPNQRNTNRIHHGILRTDATYSISPTFNIETGIRFDYVESSVDFSDLFYLPTFTDQHSFLFSNYLNGNWMAGDYWKFTAGSRFTYTNSTTRVYVEPRASVQYDRPNSAIGYWSVRLAGGLYRQFINQYKITNPGPTALVPTFSIWSHAESSETPKAWHLSNSYHFEPRETTTLNFEWFYKWQPTVYTVSYKNLLQGSTVSRSGFSAFAESTQMKTLGAGARIQQSLFNSELKLMLGYDYSYSKINLDSQFGRWVITPWNEPHRLQARALWRVLSGLSAVVKWRSVWERAWGFRQSYYNYIYYQNGQDFGSFKFDAPENDRLSPFHQLDLALIYNTAIADADVEIRADLINVLDRRNTIDWSLRPRESGGNQYQIKKRTMPGFNPSLSIQVNF